MTIHELKALNEKNGGCFFSRKNMKYMGDTMRNFSMRKGVTPNTVIVSRKRRLHPYASPTTVWTFSTVTGRVVHG